MTPTVAEFALAMTLNLLRDIPAAVQLVREGTWSPEGTWDQSGFVYGDLTGRRVGLAGFGSINRALRRADRPLPCAVTTYDPFVPDEDLDGRRHSPGGLAGRPGGGQRDLRRRHPAHPGDPGDHQRRR